MLPERTTTMGEGEEVRRERDFQSMKAVERTRAKLRSWERRVRGEEVREVRFSIVLGVVGVNAVGGGACSAGVRGRWVLSTC